MSENRTAETDVRSRVLAIPAADPSVALEYFHRMRLSCETDPFDVYHDVTEGATGFVLLDARTATAYRDGHLPGASSMPHAEITDASLAELDSGTVYVTYGWGPACNAGSRAAAKLAAAGLRVKEMIGGMEYWGQAGYPIVQIG